MYDKINCYIQAKLQLLSAMLFWQTCNKYIMNRVKTSTVLMIIPDLPFEDKGRVCFE